MKSKKSVRYFGLKKHTYIIVLLLIFFILMASVAGRHLKLQQDLTRHYLLKSVSYAQEIKSLTSYTKPTLSSLSEQDRAKYIIRKIWGKDTYVGLTIAKCESGLREKVVNSIGATGYFQILTSVHRVSIEDMQNGYANAGYAYSMYLTQGLTPWISSKECWGNQL